MTKRYFFSVLFQIVAWMVIFATLIGFVILYALICQDHPTSL